MNEKKIMKTRIKEKHKKQDLQVKKLVIKRKKKDKSRGEISCYGTSATKTMINVSFFSSGLIDSIKLASVGRR